MKTVAIVGSTGGLGKVLSQYLFQNAYSLILISRSYESLVTVDINGIKRCGLNRFFSEEIEEIDICINTACCYGRSGETYSELINANILTGLRLREHCVRNSIGLINIGTVLPKTVSKYAFTKNTLQDILGHSEDYSAVLNLNLDLFYGSALNQNNFVAQLIAQFDSSKTIELTEGKQKRNFTHISDVCSAVQYMVENHMVIKAHGKNFSLSSDHSVSVRKFILELINQYEHYFGQTNANLKFGNIKLRQDEEVMQEFFNLEKFGWRRMYDYKAGIAETIRNWR